VNRLIRLLNTPVGFGTALLTMMFLILALLALHVLGPLLLR
jgi:hypothetical protein